MSAGRDDDEARFMAWPGLFNQWNPVSLTGVERAAPGDNQTERRVAAQRAIFGQRVELPLSVVLTGLEAESLISVLTNHQQAAIRQRQQIMPGQLKIGLRVVFELLDQRMRLQAFRCRVSAHSPQTAGAPL